MFLDYKTQYCENDYTIHAIYRFNAIAIKLPMTFFTDENKKFYSLSGNTKTLKSETILRKKTEAGGTVKINKYIYIYKNTKNKI